MVNQNQHIKRFKYGFLALVVIAFIVSGGVILAFVGMTVTAFISAEPTHPISILMLIIGILLLTYLLGYLQ